MGVIDHLDKFVDLQEKYLLDKSPGVVFHAMLYPGCYPGDREITQAQLDNPYMHPNLDEVYNRISRKFLASGLIVQRLGVLNRADSDSLKTIRVRKREYAELRMVEREDVRIAQYGEFISGMLDVCGYASPFRQAFQNGVQDRDPKASFWAVFPLSDNTRGNEWRHPSLVAMMHYQDDGFKGFDVATDNFTQDLLNYVYYCRKVFENPMLSEAIVSVTLPEHTSNKPYYDWDNGRQVTPYQGGATHG